MPESQQALAALRGVEIARPGAWQLSTGELQVTPKMLEDAARYAQAKGASYHAPIKLGHHDDRFDGEPALGWLQNLRVEADADTSEPVLVGDIEDMPAWLEEAAPRHWPKRSMEGWTGYVEGGEKYELVVDGLALLGVTPPGIESLKSLRDLPGVLGVAATARISASAPVHAAMEDEEKVQYLDSDGKVCTKDHDHKAAGEKLAEKKDEDTEKDKNPFVQASTDSPKKGERMDEVKLREALGLSAEASKEELLKALAEADLAPVAASTGPTRYGAVPEGAVFVDQAVLASLQTAADEGKEAASWVKQQRMNDILDGAIKAGKFPPARREHWEKLYKVDPDGTKAHIDSMAPGLLPVQASGYAGSVEEHNQNTLYDQLYAKGV
jgi:hypothetical protein